MRQLNALDLTSAGTRGSGLAAAGNLLNTGANALSSLGANQFNQSIFQQYGLPGLLAAQNAGLLGGGSAGGGGTGGGGTSFSSLGAISAPAGFQNNSLPSGFGSTNAALLPSLQQAGSNTGGFPI